MISGAGTPQTPAVISIPRAFNSNEIQLIHFKSDGMEFQADEPSCVEQAQTCEAVPRKACI